MRARRTYNPLRKRYGHGTVSFMPWPAEEARRHQNTARHLFSRGHDYPHKGLDVDNCAFCALTHGDTDGPNYAGWARLYIEAQRPIPRKWRAAFERELASDNQAYANALRRSIATFGTPRFR
jgi:hypothetical protein